MLQQPHSRPRARSRALVLTFLALVTVVASGMPIVPAPRAAALGVGDPPIVAHQPVASAYVGQAIPIDAKVTCRPVLPCTGRLFYRVTPATGSLPNSTLGQGWTIVDLTESARTDTGQDAVVIDLTGEVPAAHVSTTGVDYFVEAQQDGKVTTVPGVPGTATAPTADTYWHVHVLNQPLVTHVPPPYVQADRDVPLTFDVTCSTANCDATLYYRTTTGPIIDEPLLETPDWPSLELQETAVEPIPGNPQAGRRITYRGSIPASHVDTRGIDYFAHVTDGTTNAWWPGTAYQGYYAPRDGMRTGYHHVHVLEPPRVTHVPVATSAYRAPIQIAADTNCAATRTCAATLYYRTTQRTVADPVDDFDSTPMTVTKTTTVEGNDVIHLAGTIPGSAADTRGVDYFFSITDGSTTSWWPGTSHVDGYAPVAGLRVGYHHVRVLEPPHITHAPPSATPALQAKTIDATISCATETCSATLYYTKTLAPVSADESSFVAIPMTRAATGTATPLGNVSTWSATIPAADVTTTGLAYFIHASDGYTQSFAPGTFYWGAYLPIDGQHAGVVDGGELVSTGVYVGTGGPDDNSEVIGTEVGASLYAGTAFVLRVLEPPHPVHVPRGRVNRYHPVQLTATSNCATPKCTATLRWLPAGTDEWKSSVMVGTFTGVTTPIGQQWQYSSWIPGADVAEDMEYGMDVDDTYVVASTPSLPLTVGDPTLASIGGQVWRDSDNDSMHDEKDTPFANAKVSLVSLGVDGAFGGLDDVVLRSKLTNPYGEYVFSDVAPGKYGLAIDDATLPAGTERLAPAAAPRQVVEVVRGQNLRTADFRYRFTGRIGGTAWIDDDSDGVFDAGEQALPGVVVSLADGTSTTSAADGTYSLRYLEPREHDVAVDVSALPDGAVSIHGPSTVITLAPHEQNGGVDFTFRVIDLGVAGPGIVEASGPDGVKVSINSNGGIHPSDVSVTPAAQQMLTVTDALASPAYEFSVPADAPAFTSATLTIPYQVDALAGFDPADLRIYHFDEAIGLWVLAGDGAVQTVDTATKTVSVTTTHFSVYAVMKLDERGWARYWASKPLRCLQADAEDPSPVLLDLVFVIDESGSMGWNDPDGVRKTAAKRVVDYMHDTFEYDSVGVVSFDGSARTRIGMTPLVTSSDRDAVKSAIDQIGVLGGTDIGAGVTRGLDVLTGQSSPQGTARVMILLTDGVGSYSDTITARAQSEGVIIHTVALGSGTDEQLLREIASDTGGEFVESPDASVLSDAVFEIGRATRDSGLDTDDDGLTNCEERNGMLSTWGMYDTSFDPTENEPFIGDRLVTSDPFDPDSDDDDLTDGEEMLGLGLGEPLDLRDFEATRQQYAFLIEAGITRYFIMRSDPEVEETDGDLLTDFDETVGVRGVDGDMHTSRADRWDTDFDGANDYMEIMTRGTNPRDPDPSELGIPGLDAYTLFQPSRYTVEGGGPVITQRWAVIDNHVRLVIYNHDPVEWDDGFECVSNCNEIRDLAESRSGGSWCWVPGRSCSSVDDRMEDIVRDAVNAQGVFNADGTIREGFVAAEAIVECRVSHASPGDCGDSDALDEAVDDADAGEELDDAIAWVLTNLPGGYRPRDLCGGSNGRGGVYELVDDVGAVRYVGQTGDFATRARQHLNDPRLSHLTMRPRYRTNNYQARRGLEERTYIDKWGDVPYQQAQAAGSLNRQRPMDPLRNRSYDMRMELVEQFLDLCL